MGSLMRGSVNVDLCDNPSVAGAYERDVHLGKLPCSSETESGAPRRVRIGPRFPDGTEIQVCESPCLEVALQNIVRLVGTVVSALPTPEIHEDLLPDVLGEHSHSAGSESFLNARENTSAILMKIRGLFHDRAIGRQEA